MSECSITSSEASKNWPEGIISVRVTMNPYLFALAIDEAYKQGLRPWDFISAAIWEKLGKPDHKTLMDYAANLEIEEEDPKWKKRLKITARHEIEMAEVVKERAEAVTQNLPDLAKGNGEPS